MSIVRPSAIKFARGTPGERDGRSFQGRLRRGSEVSSLVLALTCCLGCGQAQVPASVYPSASAGVIPSNTAPATASRTPLAPSATPPLPSEEASETPAVTGDVAGAAVAHIRAGVGGMETLSSQISDASTLPEVKSILKRMKTLADRESGWAADQSLHGPICLQTPLADYELGMTSQASGVTDALKWAANGGVGELPSTSVELGATFLGKTLSDLETVDC
jgi:hypothetical protein